MNRGSSLIVSAVASAFFCIGVAHAQLAVTAQGVKNIALNEQVGHNQFTFASDAPLEKMKGTSEGVSGSLTIDPKNLASLKGVIRTQVLTMKTGNSIRDSHIKDQQWLDAAKYPVISFTVASVSNLKVNGNTATGTVTGMFTMHGVSRTISAPFKLTYLVESEKTRQRAPGDLIMLTTNFSVALKDFNITGTQGVVGSKVGDTLDLTAQLFGSTGT